MPSTLANPCLDLLAGARPSAPTFFLDFSFDGDSAYPTGGSPGFSAALLAACKGASPPLNIDVSGIVNVIPIDCGGYDIAFDRLNNKLLVRQCGPAGGPMAEVPPNTDLSKTRFKVTVILK